MKVQDIMTRPVQTCSADTPLPAVARLMRDACCGIIPVIDPHGRVAGVVTDRDVGMALARSARNPVKMAAHEVMSSPAHACGPEDDLRAALSTMTQFRVRRLPVIGSDGRLEGIVSMDDILVRAQGSDAPTCDEIIASMREILLQSEPPALVQAHGWPL